MHALSEDLRVALTHVKLGLLPFVRECLRAKWEDKYQEREPRLAEDPKAKVLDTQALISIVLDHWETVFVIRLGGDARRVVDKVRRARNSWAHEHPLTQAEMIQALGFCQELLLLVGCPRRANEIAAMSRRLQGDVAGTEEAQLTARETSGLSIAALPAGRPPLSESQIPHNTKEIGLTRESLRQYREPLEALEAPPPRPVAPRPTSDPLALFDPKGDIGAFFEMIGRDVVDKRRQGGCLWIVDDEHDLEPTMKLLAARYGLRFRFASEGGRATKHAAAWYL